MRWGLRRLLCSCCNDSLRSRFSWPLRRWLLSPAGGSAIWRSKVLLSKEPWWSALSGPSVATGRWRVVVVVALASFVIANVGRYQVNDKLDALGGDTSGWVGPTSRLATLALLLGLSLAGAYVLRGDDSA